MEQWSQGKLGSCNIPKAPLGQQPKITCKHKNCLWKDMLLYKDPIGLNSYDLILYDSLGFCVILHIKTIN